MTSRRAARVLIAGALLGQPPGGVRRHNNELLPRAARALQERGGRLAVQLLYFRPGAYLNTAFLRIGYNALTVLFVYFTAVYGVSALGVAG